jgi:hypothetical protein
VSIAVLINKHQRYAPRLSRIVLISLHDKDGADVGTFMRLQDLLPFRIVTIANEQHIGVSCRLFYVRVQDSIRFAGGIGDVSMEDNSHRVEIRCRSERAAGNGRILNEA